MIIRKLYRFESAHILRNAVSQRCSASFHGHSGVVEVFLSADGLDRAGMVYDFGAFKQTIGSFIDMFDHSVHLYKNDKEEVLDFFKKNNERYIVLPCNPTAENYCVLFKDCIEEILKHSLFSNDEKGVYCRGVRYHETATGYAESESGDTLNISLKDIVFSEKTIEEASNQIKEILSISGAGNDSQ